MRNGNLEQFVLLFWSMKLCLNSMCGANSVFFFHVRKVGRLYSMSGVDLLHTKNRALILCFTHENNNEDFAHHME